MSKELTDKMRDKLAAGFAKGDRFAELEELVEACKADAREAEAYAAELEAKLALAVEALEWVKFGGGPRGERYHELARTTLAALKGQADE